MCRVKVKYLVEPKDSRKVINKPLEAAMAELKKHPEKVIFSNEKYAVMTQRECCEQP